MSRGESGRIVGSGRVGSGRIGSESSRVESESGRSRVGVESVCGTLTRGVSSVGPYIKVVKSLHLDIKTRL